MTARLMPQGDLVLITALADWFGMASDNHTIAQTKSRMLLALWRAGGQPLAFSQLAHRSGCSSEPSTQRVHVCRLRKALPPGSVETVLGVGWRLTPVGLEAVAEAFHDLVRVILAATDQVAGVHTTARTETHTTARTEIKEAA